MSNPFVNNQNKSNSQNSNQQPLDFEKLFAQFKENPAKYLANLNLPPSIQTPEQAVRYLASTNQIPPLIQKQVYGMLGKK